MMDDGRWVRRVAATYAQCELRILEYFAVYVYLHWQSTCVRVHISMSFRVSLTAGLYS